MANTNKDALDRFTLHHAAFGALLGIVGAPAWVAITTSIAWELSENRLKDKYPEQFHDPSHDSLKNAAMDSAAMVAGWYLGSRFSARDW